MDNILKNNEYENNKKVINLTEKNKNKNIIENNSPGPECLPYQKGKVNQIINKELKKKYIKDFFGHMKNYSKENSNNIRRANWGKSPDLNRRENILDLSPDKIDNNQKVLTLKKGYKNYYSNDNNIKKEYKYLKIDKKVNDIFIPACYDTPQRNQYLNMINEKRKQNPDKIIEFLIPQFPPMFPMNPYQNMYQPYNQYNPYMNMYMMPPPPQYQIQNPQIINNNIKNNNYNSGQKNNKKNNSNSNSGSINNKIEKNEYQTPENLNNINNFSNQINVNVKINNTPNPNALLFNNNDINNSKSNKSTGNSNSGNNIDANLHSSNNNSNNNNNNNQSDDFQ